MGARVAAWRNRPEVAVAAKWGRRLMLAGVIVYLCYRLSQVGWADLLQNLPSSIWFYVIFAVRYLALPFSEVPAYERVWKVPLWKYITAFIRKRVYNSAVVGYSGEAFFTLWARRRLDLPEKVILFGVKDNNILSAFASNFSTVALILFLLIGDNLQPGLDAAPGAVFFFVLAFLSSFGLVAAVVLFGSKVLHVTRRDAAFIATIHGVRMLATIVLHAALYAVAIPGTPLEVWLVFIALQLVISRIPFLPNQDLVFLGAALSLASITGAPEAAIAGMLVTEACLSLILSVAFFAVTAHDARMPKVPAEKCPKANGMKP
ncbi:MAG: hypothetical protein AAGH38_08285 [Pseudomonadota bacterium]